MATNNKSIAKKLTAMNLLVSGTALLLACAAFFAYDQFTFRESLVRTLSAQAQIIASNSASALIFNDPQSANSTLIALKSSPNIASAGIFDIAKKPLAQYARDRNDEILNIPGLPPGSSEAYWFRGTHLVLVRSIIFQGKSLGTVYIRADLDELDHRLKRYAAISLVVLLLSLGAALFVSALFRRAVAQPIMDLAKTAQIVSQERNYSVRAAPTRERDEVSLLINAFNEMLAQIQQRDNALQNARNELENRVAERTRELVLANRELEAFSYSVSHDLRGPLEAVNGSSYLLEKNYGNKFDPKGRESLQSIRSAARRMSELIDDLLNLSRVTTSALQRQEIDLSVFARLIMEQLCRTQAHRKVEFVAPATAKAYADARLVQIALENLLGNAWKYTSRREEARVEFGVEHRNGKVVYFVRDDGSGFDPRSSNRLFKPFQRLHSSSEFSGSGIGLATVHRIIERHGGEVWAEGAVDEGATFYFTLGPSELDVPRG